MEHRGFSLRNRNANEFSREEVDAYREVCRKRGEAGSDVFEYSAKLDDDDLRQSMEMQEKLQNDPTLYGFFAKGYSVEDYRSDDSIPSKEHTARTDFSTND